MDNTVRVYHVRSASPLALPLVLLAAVLALALPAAGANAAEVPSFQCRASVLAASLAGAPYVEPLVANGLKGSVPGPTFDKALCSNDEQGAGDLSGSAGLNGLLGTSAASVKTTLTPELGSSKDQTATATTTLADVDLKLLGTPSLLRIGAVRASAQATCVNGKAQFTGSSEITNISLAGNPISLDGLVDGIGKLATSLGLDGLVKVYPLNQVTKTADGVVVTPLRIQVLSGGAATGGLVDLTIGETKVAQRGDACNPPATPVDPTDPGTGGDGICPVGSIPVGTGPRVCQIPATDRYGTVVIGVPNSTDTPRGGRVIPLTEARALAAAGLLPNSKCLSGPGLDYVVLGDANKNRIYGTKNADRILGLGKTDALSGLDGKDCLDGGTGNDRLYGGSGNDRLYGGTGNDHVYGENGNDTISGDAGRDYLYGDKGNDRISGLAGNDTILGGQGNDSLLGGTGNDQLYGNDGRDTLDGGGGSDRLSGGYNTNTIVAGAGRALVVNGKPSGSGHSTIDLRKTTRGSVVKCGSRRDVVLVNRTTASKNRYSSNCSTIRVSR